MPLINPAHLYRATCHSLAGLAHAFRTEQAFRHEVLLLPLLGAALALTDKGIDDWLIVMGGWLIVMLAELLNSAVEKAFDLISRERNEHIKAGKDMASAAIFLAMAVNAGIWVRVFLL